MLYVRVSLLLVSVPSLSRLVEGYLPQIPEVMNSTNYDCQIQSLFSGCHFRPPTWQSLNDDNNLPRINACSTLSIFETY